MPDPVRDLRRQLCAEPLPPSYVDSILDDLADHFEDVRDACLARGMSPEASTDYARESIGEPTIIAGAAAANWRSDHRLARHPWAVVIGVPLLLLPVLQLATSIVAALPFYQGPAQAFADAHWLAAFLATCATTAIISYATLKGVADQFGQASWLLRSGIAIAAAAMLWQAQVQLPQLGPGTGMLSLGLAVVPTPFTCIQALIPLAMLALILIKRKNNHQSERLGLDRMARR